MKFCIEDRVNPLSDCELRENRDRENYTLRKGLNEVLSVFPTFFIRFGKKKFGTSDVHKNLSIVIFVKIRAGKAVLFVRESIQLHLYAYRNTE